MTLGSRVAGRLHSNSADQIRRKITVGGGRGAGDRFAATTLHADQTNFLPMLSTNNHPSPTRSRTHAWSAARSQGDSGRTKRKTGRKRVKRLLQHGLPVHAVVRTVCSHAQATSLRIRRRRKKTKRQNGAGVETGSTDPHRFLRQSFYYTSTYARTTPICRHRLRRRRRRLPLTLQAL